MSGETKGLLVLGAATIGLMIYDGGGWKEILPWVIVGALLWVMLGVAGKISR